jgi:hypothetical protein
MATKLYNALRRRAGTPSSGGIAIDVLGRDLRYALECFSGICLVAHPVVARIASDVCRTWFIHGEIAAPPECAVQGVEKIFVPLESAGKRLVEAGADPKAVAVTGLIVEPDLAAGAEDASHSRLRRIDSGDPLTIGFFTSGAYPREHMRKMEIAAGSVIKGGMRAVIFCGTKRSVFRRLRTVVSDWNVPVIEYEAELASDGISGDSNWRVMLVRGSTRREATDRAIRLLPSLDAFVAAAHERTNWAAGLGIPMWMLLPHIGTFAPENFAFATELGVALPLATDADAAALGRSNELARSNGDLARMAGRGFGELPIDGARRIAGLALQAVSPTE